jgi:(1->4)-alpha-D-glucan 1-alpha-D-glucosylmutase
VRARLAALSEGAQEWAALLPAWLKAIGPLRTKIDGVPAPSDGDIAMLLQMIVGAWPPDLAPGDAAGRKAFAERLAGWQEKAQREAKLHSDWAAVDEGYEQAARLLLMRLLADGALPDLLAGLASLAEAIAPAGAVNGLAQTLLRHTVPGVPDLYQGCDLWDMSLVDPDNRRPVDYGKRTAAVDASLSDLVANWRDGRIKQRLIRRALHLRKKAPALFREGAYRPVRVQGDAADRIVAFTRSLGDAWMLVLAPRLVGRELSPGTISLAAGNWPGTELVLDDRPRIVPLHDWLGGGIVEILHERAKADFLCGTLPLALISTVPPDANC